MIVVVHEKVNGKKKCYEWQRIILHTHLGTLIVNFTSNNNIPTRTFSQCNGLTTLNPIIKYVNSKCNNYDFRINV